jgi:hypothetical protein
MVLSLILGLRGFTALLSGVSWGTVLPPFAIDLARTENALSLINPNHICLAHAVVPGLAGLGNFLTLSRRLS